MLVLNVRYMIKPGMREEFIKIVLDERILAASKNEEGNMRYDFFYPIDSKDDIFLIEQWKDKETWEAHKRTKHVMKLQEIKKEYVVNMIPNAFEATAL